MKKRSQLTEARKAIEPSPPVRAIAVASSLSILNKPYWMGGEDEDKEAIFRFITDAGEKALADPWVQLQIQMWRTASIEGYPRMWIENDGQLIPIDTQPFIKRAADNLRRVGVALGTVGSGRRRKFTQAEQRQRKSVNDLKAKQKLDEQTRLASASLEEEVAQACSRSLRRSNRRELDPRDILKIAAPFIQKYLAAKPASHRRAATKLQEKLEKAAKRASKKKSG